MKDLVFFGMVTITNLLLIMIYKGESTESLYQIGGGISSIMLLISYFRNKTL